MAREKYQTLTEQMFYILLCLRHECCGVDMMKRIDKMTEGRVKVGAGTMYTLLDNFTKEGLIRETSVENRKKSYQITEIGQAKLEAEYHRLQAQIADFDRIKEEHP